MKSQVFIAAAAAFAVVSTSATAQVVIGGIDGGVVVGPPGGPIDPISFCDEYWVDPVNGSNANSGALVAPFRTINHAMNSVRPPAVINLLPGRYSPSSNGDFWPLFCVDGISIQGTNMLNTVLDGEGSDVMWIGSTGFGDDFRETNYDGFTITGAASAVRFIDEFLTVRPTLSNMVIVGNNIGIDMFAIDLGPDASPDDTNNDGFIEFRPTLINLTIADNQIGILDTNNASPPFGPAEPAIVNCAIYPNAVTDIEGVDQSDLVSTWFCSANQAGISGLQQGKQPPFASVALCNTDPDKIYVDRSSLDYRLVPETIFLDRGVTTNITCHGQPVKTRFQCRQRVFDADGEGYCNARIHGDAIDIGADETGELIIAGFIPGTTTFGTASNGTAFDQARIYVSGPFAASYTAFLYVGLTPNTGYLDWTPTTIPGSRAEGTTAPTPVGERGLLCIDAGTLIPPASFLVDLPTDPVVVNITLPPVPLRHNTQSIPFQGGLFGELSNLQSYLLTP